MKNNFVGRKDGRPWKSTSTVIKKKKKKYKCDICKDTGKWTNPFDQEFKCDCKIKKRKRADYRGFVLHIWEWNKKGIPYGIAELKDLSKTYNCPIPKEHR